MQVKFEEFTLRTQAYLRGIYDTIQLSRERRREAGFETGWARMTKDNSLWYRNVDPLPPFADWMAQSDVEVGA